jgi:hypothetical protein
MKEALGQRGGENVYQELDGQIIFILNTLHRASQINLFHAAGIFLAFLRSH